MSIIEIIKTILFSIPRTSDAEAMRAFAGMSGRGTGQYAEKLRDWLESNPSALPEIVRAQLMDHPQDMGVDVLLEGITSGTRIGFQVKSENDLAKKDLTQKLKAQLTDALATGIDIMIVIFACKPTERNKLKYQYMQNFASRLPEKQILIMEPGRAAGILKSFGSKMPTPAAQDKNWSSLFVETGQELLAPLYLDLWPSILPHERFQPPSEYNNILKSLEQFPITILTGPPASGKTFTALQVLWQAYKKNMNVRWIPSAISHATEGPIPLPPPRPDMRERVDLLTRTLGCEPRRCPIDIHDFISRNLPLNSIVYIEDPFGKSDDDFKYCLQTYDFFDLETFLQAIGSSGLRKGCHILITSRDGLFERWRSECDPSKHLLSEIKIIHIGKESYSSDQRYELAKLLLNKQGNRNTDIVAEPIARNTDLPYDVEIVVRALNAGATEKEAENAAKKIKADLTEISYPHLAATTDQELLFLLLLDCLSTGGHGRNFFKEVYATLFKALKLKGNAEDALGACKIRYRLYFSEHPVLLPKGRSRKISPFHLEPIHSTINEGIRISRRASYRKSCSLR